MTLPYLETAMTQAYGTTPIALQKLIGMSVKNVKAFGAVGDGAADDTVAIQAAIDYATSPYSTTNANIIFFPPGIYLVTSSILLDNTGGANKSYILLGGGGSAAGGPFSRVTGNFADAIFKQSDAFGGGNTQYIKKISQLWINNDNPDGIGLALDGMWPGIVRDCMITASNGIIGEQNIAITIQNCKLAGQGFGTTGRGIVLGGQSSVHGCDITSFYDGIVMFGSGGVITGCRLEINVHYAMALGVLRDGTWDSLVSALVGGNLMEGNGTGIFGHNLDGCTVAGNRIHAEDNNGSFGGLRLRGGGGTTIQNIKALGNVGFVGAVFGSISGSTMTVTSTYYGFSGLAVGQHIYDSGGSDVGTISVGSGGTGSYTLTSPVNTSAQRLMAVSFSSTNPMVQVEKTGGATAVKASRMNGIDSSITDSGHGVEYTFDDGHGWQLESVDYTPTTQTIANRPTSSTAVDGDLWLFTNGHASTLEATVRNSADTGSVTIGVTGVDIVAAGTGSTRVWGKYSATDDKWYSVAKG